MVKFTSYIKFKIRKKNAPSGNCSITGFPVIFEPGSPGWEPEMLTATQMAQLNKKERRIFKLIQFPREQLQGTLFS